MIWFLPKAKPGAICWVFAGKTIKRHCPRCRERRLYRLASGRRRCSRCDYTFHDFSQRFLNLCGLSCRQWLWFLKLTELWTPARDMAGQMGVAYATALKAQDTLRRAILAQALDARALRQAEAEADPQASPVFGLVEIGGVAICDVLPDVTAESLLHFKLNFRLKTASQGPVVYTAPYRNYLTLLGCGPALWPTRLIHHDDKRLPADAGGFWPWAKRQLSGQRGLGPATFALRLKELELRYNYRDQDVFPLLAKALCGFVPDG
jgi:transposase